MNHEKINEVDDLEHQEHEQEKKQRAHKGHGDLFQEIPVKGIGRARKHRTYLLIISLILSLTLEGSAQAGAFKTIGEDLISPWTTKALTPFLVGAGLAATVYALKAEISYPVQRSITTHRPLDGLAGFGDWSGRIYPNLIYTGYALLSGALGNKRGYLRAEEMILATAYSGGLTSLLKVTFREGRPNNPADKKSFPSGHATTAFAFAGVVGAEHEWYIAVPAYAIATITAYSRINDNKHYLHDVIAGGTIGLAYALGVYYRRLEGESLSGVKVASSVPTFTILPTDNLDGAILGAFKRF